MSNDDYNLFGGIDRGRNGRDNGASVAMDNAGDWTPRAKAALRDLAKTGREFNADDLREIVGPPPTSHNAMGGIFLWGTSRNIIVKVGERTMTRAKAHARRTAVYVGRGAA